MEGYKYTAIGWIPEDWEALQLNSVIKLVNGKAFKPGEWEKSGLPIIRIQNLNDSEASFNYYSGPVDKRYYVNNGDILFAWSGTKGISFGARIWKNNLAILNQHIFKVLPKEKKITPDYSYLVLKAVQNSIESKAHGFKSSFVHVKKQDLDKIFLPLPPLFEQKAIAALLSTWDDAITLNTRLITQKEQRKKWLMQNLLTGKKRLKGFEGEWNEVRLGKIALISTGAKDLQNKVENGTYPFFVRSDEVERIDTYSYDGEAILIPGDGRIGEIFHYMNGRFDYHQRVYKISDFSECIFGLYCFYYFKQFFKKQALGHTVKATVDSLRMPIFTEFKINLPPKEEQTAIAAILQTADNEINLLLQKLAALKAQKKGLMQVLLIGKKRLKNINAIL